MKTSITILFAVLIVGCMTTEKATGYLKKKGQLAIECVKAFPVNDSFGEPKITGIKKADNQDLTGAINNLEEKANQVIQQPDSNCKKEAIELKKEVAKLKEQYKPCKPDTVEIEVPHYIRDTKYEQAVRDSACREIEGLERAFRNKDSKLKATQDTLAYTKACLKQVEKERDKWQWKAIITWIIAVAILVSLIFWRVKK